MFSAVKGDVTPLHIVGTIDRMDRCDIYCA